METLEEKATSALTNYDSGSGAIRLEDVLKLTMQLNREAEAGNVTEDMSVLKQLFRAIDDYIARARPVVNSESTIGLDPVVTSCLKFVNWIVESDSAAHEYFRDETGILATLTATLKDKYSDNAQMDILRSIELVSRGLIVTWCLPYLSNLIKQIFALLLKSEPSSSTFVYGLRIVTNLVYNNHSCVTILVRDHEYKNVIKKLITLFEDGRKDPEVTVMAYHITEFTENTVLLTPLLKMKRVQTAFKDVARKIKLSDGDDHLRNIAGGLQHITSFLSTLLSKLATQERKNLMQPDVASQDVASQDVRPDRWELVNVICSDTVKFVNPILENAAVLRTRKGERILKSLLLLAKALYPTCLPHNVYDGKIMESLVKFMDSLANLIEPRSKCRVVVLETYLHFVDRILESKGREFPDTIFERALQSCQINVSSSSNNLICNILSIRLLTRLGTMSVFHDKVRKLLHEDLLSGLLQCLLNSTDSTSSSRLLRSTCVVEALTVLSKLSKSPTAFMECLNKEETWAHISYCIVNGEEQLIAQALALTGTVGFTVKCRAGLSKELIKTMRCDSLTKNGSSEVRITDQLGFVTTAGQVGMRRLNADLEMVLDNHEGRGPALDEVITWFKLKTEVHELELANMKEHVLRQNGIISQLKTLLEKQSEVLAKRELVTASLEKDQRDKDAQMQSLKERKIQMELKHAKGLEALAEQLEYQGKITQATTEKNLKLEQELLHLRNECKQLSEANELSTQANLQVTVAKDKLQAKLEESDKECKTSRQKIASLEKDLKKCEDAKKSIEALLEAERRKTEIISQVLGNRLT